MPILTVHLEKITNLADEDHIGKSDPYVKVCLVLCWFVPWVAACENSGIARLQLHLLPLASPIVSIVSFAILLASLQMGNAFREIPRAR